MNKLIFAILLLLAWAHSPVLAGTGIEQPFLWRVTGTSGVPCHIFGSIHIPSPTTTNLPASVEDVLRASDAVFCELPFDDETIRRAALAGFNARRPLSQVLPTNLFARTDAELRRIMPALSLKALDRAEVWTIAFQLMVLEDQLKYPDVPPLDLLFYRRARAAGKIVGGLETLEEQVAAMNKFSEAEQIDLLRATLDDMDGARKHGTTPSAELLALYLAGDERALDGEADRVLKEYDPALRRRFEETLLAERNRVMTDRIVAKLKAAPTQRQLFVIGALHGLGTGSVLDLLGRAGFKVERVKN